MRSIKINVINSRNQDDIRLTFNRPLFQFFCCYLKFYCRPHFTAFRILNNLPEFDTLREPIVIYSNHPAWWDPIHFMLLHQRCFPNRPAFGPMDAEALNKYQLFKKIGIFPLKLHSLAGAKTFLKCSQAILTTPGAVLWITAEGQFTDCRQRPPLLQAGLAHLLRRIHPLWVVPLAIEYPFWNEARPEALSCFGEPWLIDGSESYSIPEYLKNLQNRLVATQEHLAAAAIARNPLVFQYLLEGKRSIGMAYDAWRRFKCIMSGKKFYSGHEEKK